MRFSTLLVLLVFNVSLCAEVFERETPSDWPAFTMPWGSDGKSRASVAFLLHKPAGKHGHVTVKDGHFHYKNGKRARFWGFTIGCGGSSSPTHAEAEALARRLAELGCNMVRFNAIDLEARSWSEQAGFVKHDDKGNLYFDKERMDRFDYFINELKKNGVYYMFSPINAGAREWIESDGIPGWEEFNKLGRHAKAKCAAGYFNKIFLDHFKDFAKKFLTHKNPYTGYTYAKDPGVACMQMTNENFLFSTVHWDMPAVYKAELITMWNEWLVKKYKNTKGLRDAWTVGATNKVFLPNGQGLDDKNVDLFKINHNNPAHADKLLFIGEIEDDFYKEMKDYMRSLGVKVPITGTNINQSRAHLYHTAKNMDHVAHHRYWDLYSYEEFHNIPMLFNPPRSHNYNGRRWGNVPGITSAKVVDRGVVISEIASPWPNEFRAVDTLTVAAYAALQDLDIINYYCYQSADTQGWEPTHIVGETWGSNDPSVLGPYQMGALMFLRGDVKIAKNLVKIGTSNTDVHYFDNRMDRQGSTTSMMSWPGESLSYISRVETQFFDTVYPKEDASDLVISAGVSSSGDYKNAKRLILGAMYPAVDPIGKDQNWNAFYESLYPKLKAGKKTALTLDASDFAGKKDTKVTISAPLAIKDLPKGAVPLIVNDSKEYSLGFSHKNRAIFPSLHEIGRSSPDTTLSLYTHLMREWKLLDTDQGFIEPGVIVSDTGELKRDSNKGVFTVNTDFSILIGGFHTAPITCGPMTVDCKTDYAVFSLASMTDDPISKSRTLLLMVVSKASNTGQKWQNKKADLPAREQFDTYGFNRMWIVKETGKGPVCLRPIEASVKIKMPGTKVPVVNMLDVDGKVKGQVKGVKRDGKMVVIPITAADATIHYEILKK